MNRYLLVMLGAALGGLARYVIGSVVMQRFGGRFPLGTLVVNVMGCFLIGILMPLLTERGEPRPNLRLLLVVGVLGGYTTFSSFAWESFQAMDEGSRWIGFANVALSVILGYLAVWCGALLVRR
ncbi:MAG: fluoride efflux transporter CrcB [Acidobacteriota bacterium]